MQDFCLILRLSEKSSVDKEGTPSLALEDVQSTHAYFICSFCDAVLPGECLCGLDQGLFDLRIPS
jgi:hypothetical protein